MGRTVADEARPPKDASPQPCGIKNVLPCSLTQGFRPLQSVPSWLGVGTAGHGFAGWGEAGGPQVCLQGSPRPSGHGPSCVLLSVSATLAHRRQAGGTLGLSAFTALCWGCKLGSATEVPREAQGQVHGVRAAARPRSLANATSSNGLGQRPCTEAAGSVCTSETTAATSRGPRCQGPGWVTAVPQLPVPPAVPVWTGRT